MREASNAFVAVDGTSLNITDNRREKRLGLRVMTALAIPRIRNPGSSSIAAAMCGRSCSTGYAPAHPHGRPIAHVPYQRTLEQFELAAQPSIDPEVIREVSSCRFIDSAENVMLLAPPGVGKTHLAVAIGLEHPGRELPAARDAKAGLIKATEAQVQ